MTIVQTNEFRTGMKIIIDNNLCEIIDHQFHKPGKGQAVMRVKYKNLSTSQVLDKTFKTGETVEKADIDCLLYTSPSPRDLWISRMPSSA